MTAPSKQRLDFGATISQLQSGQVLEYETGTKRTPGDIAQETFAALQSPLDFPPLASAIVPGDRVAMAVDPNVPAIDEIVEGAVRAIKQAGAGEIDVIVSDEAIDLVLESITKRVGDASHVSRHQPTQRESLRYLGADEVADPIYLNRWLVDADFVLPIAAGRSLDANCDRDLTGVFPAFADSRARRRYHAQQASGSDADRSQTVNSEEPAWLLGIQVMINVTANNRGMASQITAGTPDAIRKQRTTSRRTPDDFPPSAPLVVASLDGDAQQQSWVNAARAVAAAARYTSPNGTIVLWSELDQPLSVASHETLETSDTTEPNAGITEDDLTEEFPSWNPDEFVSRTLARVAEEHRLLIHSQLSQETIESMGYGAIESVQQLAKLSQSFDSCGVLRAAQFAGTTVDQTSSFST